MANISNIFMGHAGPIIQKYINGMVTFFSNMAQKSGIVYEPLPGTSLTGPPIPSITDIKTLIATIGLQHTTPYWGFIGIQDWVDWIMKQLSNQPGIEDLALEELAEDELLVPEV
jgi:hypothetical protein